MKTNQSDRWLWLIIAILCATAVGKVIIQDVPRIRFCALTHNDVQQLYLGSRAWLQGKNPYVTDVLFSEMKQANPEGVAELTGPCTVDCELYYPPSALPVLALPALMPWKVFHVVYLASCILAYLFALYRLSLLIAIPIYRYLFVALGLAFSPYHAGLGTNNISALLIPLLLVSTLCFDSTWTFVLIGIIASVKPPLALVLLFYFMLRRNRKVVTISIPVILAISTLSLVRLHAVAWWPAYMDKIRQYSAGSGTMGVTYHGVLNYGFSNLQALFYAIFHNVHYAVVGNYLTLVFLGMLFTWWVLRWPAPNMSSNVNILTFSIVGCLTLFQTSLQYYNYVFLLAVGVFAVRQQSKAVRIGLMAALCSFVLPPGLLLSLSHQSSKPLNAAIQLALPNGSWAGHHLTRGQELLVCTPSIIFLLITAYLMVALQAKWKRSALTSGMEP